MKAGMSYIIKEDFFPTFFIALWSSIIERISREVLEVLG
jgi:hypothetical protein